MEVKFHAGHVFFFSRKHFLKNTYRRGWLRIVIKNEDIKKRNSVFCGLSFFSPKIPTCTKKLILLGSL
jgi:hypothetical protein